MGAVKFGTDGWRGVIADDFTYANVRVAARAIAHYVLADEDASKGVCLGWDTRLGRRRLRGSWRKCWLRRGFRWRSQGM